MVSAAAKPESGDNCILVHSIVIFSDISYHTLLPFASVPVKKYIYENTGSFWVPAVFFPKKGKTGRLKPLRQPPVFLSDDPDDRGDDAEQHQPRKHPADDANRSLFHSDTPL